MVAQDCTPAIDSYVELTAHHHRMVYRDRLMDSVPEKNVRGELQTLWGSMASDEQARTSVILRAAHYGQDPQPEFRDYHDRLRKVILSTRGQIHQATRNLIGRRRMLDPVNEFLQALVDSHLWGVLRVNRIFAVETVIPRQYYVGYDAEDFVGTLVKLALKTIGSTEPYEYVWVKNIDHFDDKDGSGDELGGFLMAKPRSVEGFEGNAYISFKVSEVQDFKELQWEAESGETRNQGRQAIQGLYDVAPRLNDEEAYLVWDNMSLRERTHVVDFYELLTKEAERTLKRDG